MDDDRQGGDQLLVPVVAEGAGGYPGTFADPHPARLTATA